MHLDCSDLQPVVWRHETVCPVSHLHVVRHRKGELRSVHQYAWTYHEILEHQRQLCQMRTTTQFDKSDETFSVISTERNFESVREVQAGRLLQLNDTTVPRFTREGDAEERSAKFLLDGSVDLQVEPLLDVRGFQLRHLSGLMFGRPPQRRRRLE